MISDLGLHYITYIDKIAFVEDQLPYSRTQLFTMSERNQSIIQFDSGFIANQFKDSLIIIRDRSSRL